MKIHIMKESMISLAVDSVILGIYEGTKRLEGEAKEIDHKLGGILEQMLSLEEFLGKKMEQQIIHTLGRIAPKKIILIGLGSEEKVNEEAIRNVIGQGIRTAQRIGSKTTAIYLGEALEKKMCPISLGESIAEGAFMSLYRFDKYKTQKEEKKEKLEEIYFFKTYEAEDEQLQKGVDRGIILAQSVNLARDLVNEPGNGMTPRDLAEIASKIALKHGMDIEVLEKEDMEGLGMNAFLGVSKGSAEPPKLIFLEYKGRKDTDEKIAFVGKGITFDSGGISIKPAAGMEEMKDDMAGAAAVIGAMDAIGGLKPEINIIAVIPACENLPSGTAQKPGDVVKSMNGKTIEIINTDAEGRLILADGISYAMHRGAQKIVDIATLTGACVVAFGHVTTGALTNNDGLWKNLQEASEKAGEKIWQMPAFEEYKELLKSDVADIKNTGGRWAGMITAGLFIEAFVENKPWVHIDIAGTVASQKDNGYRVKGPTGVGVRTLAHLAEILSKY
ncbi:MAG: leucyl aminopeptidase [Thermotaleaceae bacterium]